MSKLRVYDLAKKHDIASKEFVKILNTYNIPVKNHMSALTDQQVEEFEGKFDKKKYLEKAGEQKKPATGSDQAKKNKKGGTTIKQEQANKTTVKKQAKPTLAAQKRMNLKKKFRLKNKMRLKKTTRRNR